MRPENEALRVENLLFWGGMYGLAGGPHPAAKGCHVSSHLPRTGCPPGGRPPRKRSFLA